MTAPTPVTAEQRHAQVLAEYGAYVALAPIDINGTRAFNEGDPVPSSHVESGGVLEGSTLVAKLSTKTGRAAAGIDEEKKG